MESPLDNQGVQYLSSSSKQAVHAIRVELNDMLDQKQALSEGLSNAIAQCGQLLESDDIRCYPVLADYAALLLKLLEKAAQAPGRYSDAQYQESLVRGLNPFAFALQSLSRVAEMHNAGFTPLSLPANELNAIFSEPLVYPEFASSYYKDSFVINGENHWFAMKQICEGISISVSLLITCVEKQCSYQSLSLGDLEYDQQTIKAEKEINGCLADINQQLINDQSLHQLDPVVVSLLGNIFSLFPNWLELLKARKLNEIQIDSGLQLISVLTRYTSQDFDSEFTSALRKFVYFFVQCLARLGSENSDLANSEGIELLAKFGMLEEQGSSINDEWQSYFDRSFNLSMPDLDAINALAESIADYVQIIKEQIESVVLDAIQESSFDDLRKQNGIEQIADSIDARLKNLQEVVRFIPKHCLNASDTLVANALAIWQEIKRSVNEDNLNRFAETLLSIEANFEGLFLPDPESSSNAALLVQIKALINQLEVSYRRCSDLTLDDMDSSADSLAKDNVEKLLANINTLVGVSSFVSDKILSQAIDKIIIAVKVRFSQLNVQGVEGVDQIDPVVLPLAQYDQRLILCVEKAQHYSDSLLRPELGASIDLAAVDLNNAIQQLNVSEAPDLLGIDKEIESDSLESDSISVKETSDQTDDSVTSEQAVPDAKEPLSNEIDDEIADIFLEEAEEVIEALEAHAEKIPKGSALTPDQAESWNDLKECRRYFHTLKGSGRMACAVHLGEFAWAIESMLNRVLDQAVPCEAIHVDTVLSAIAAVPKLVEEFRFRVVPDPAYLSIEKQAQALEKGEFVESVDEDLEPAEELLEGVDSAIAEANAISENKEAPVLDSNESASTEATDKLSDNVIPLKQDFVVDSSEAHAGQMNAAQAGSAKAVDHQINDQSQVSVIAEGELDAPVNDESLIGEPVDDGLETDRVHNDHIDFEESEVLTNENSLPDTSEVEASVTDDSEDNVEAVFTEEVRTTVEELKALLVEAQNGTNSNVLLKSAVIKMHGLSGSAKLIDFREATKVAHIAEAHLESIPPSEQSDEQLLVLVSAYCDLLEKLASLETSHDKIVEEAIALKESFVQSTQHEFEKQSAKETIQACRLLFDMELVVNSWRTNKAQGQAFDLLVCELGMLRESPVLPTNVRRLIDQLNKIYEFIEGRALNHRLYMLLGRAHEELVNSLSAVMTDQELPELPSLAQVQRTLREFETEASATNDAQVSKDSSALTGSESGSAEAVVDQEILAIFVEELDELTEDLTSCLNGWRAEPNNLIMVEALLRPLHTLKGSARMAGVQALADEAHAIESGIQAQLESDKPHENSRMKELQLSVDQLLAHCGQVEQPKAGSDETNKPKFVERRSKDREEPRKTNQMLRLPAATIERLANLAGESNVSRSIVEQHISEFGYGFEEIEATLTRLTEQIRRLEIESEAQIAFGIERAEQQEAKEFDPLEMDRYSKLQQISRSLAESCSDLKDLHGTFKDKTRLIETALMQQSRIGRELHISLQQTRTIPLSKVLIPRVRKTLSALSKELEKPVALSVLKVDGELDRNVIERLTGPVEHILRNAIDHGLEDEKGRLESGKPTEGLICLDVFRQGSELVIEIKDDGKGIDIDKVRKKAVMRGLLNEDHSVSDDEAIQKIFEPGFSTAHQVTQISGRGVGLDVVSSEIASMGGSVSVSSTLGEGTLFRLRIPFSVAMSRALLVNVSNETFAIPLDSIVGVVRVSSFELEEQYHSDNPKMIYANQEYDFHYLGKLLMDVEPDYNLEHFAALPVLLARMGDRLVAVQVDALLGSREITVKTLNSKFSAVFGVSGATILGNGKVVTILDLPELVGKKSKYLHANSHHDASYQSLNTPHASSNTVPRAMVVDDSVTVRKVTSRLLERQDIEVLLAKDGQDALEQLENVIPDVILLDVEMPRIDGFEVLERIGRDERLKQIPIIMISSRSGEKHQQRARELGARAFLGKPYQDALLLEVIAEHCAKIADQHGTASWVGSKAANG